MSRSRSRRRLAVFGPLPPPVHGQTEVTARILEHLRARVPDAVVVDTNATRGLGSRLASLWRVVRNLRVVRADVVYVAVKAGRGMSTSAFIAGLAHREGARVVLHHHSYALIDSVNGRSRRLMRAAGPDAVQVVLSESMAQGLRNAYPAAGRVAVVGNAITVDASLADVPLRVDDDEPVLGHLSNLSRDKGIVETVDLAIALRDAGHPMRLLIAGSPWDAVATAQIARAVRELGPLFEHLGPVTGDAKVDFFGRITHFVFPTSYAHEAAPLVLYEAMAAGAVCATTRQGSIPEQVSGAPALLADTAATFVGSLLPVLASSRVTASDSERSRDAFSQALARSRIELESLCALLAGESV